MGLYVQNPIKSNQNLFNENHKLRGLLDHAHYLSAVQKRVSAHLSSPLNEHCHVANINHQVLIMHIDSAAWLQAFRFEMKPLLDYLNTLDMGTIREIKSFIRPIKPLKIEVHQTTRPPLSKNNISLLLATADAVRDAELAESLRKLASLTTDR